MLFLFLLSIILLALILLRSPYIKGFLGEYIVKLIIGKPSEEPGKEKFLIHNFILQYDFGKTSQIDHIVVNTEGVFVIETKNYSGCIYGNDTQREWTQVLNYGRTKYRFYNPVKQNYTHMHRIKNILPDKTPIFSIVVFVKGNIAYIESMNVYTPWDLFSILNPRIPEHRLSPGEIKEISNILVANNRSSEISNFEHIQNIRNMQENIDNGLCPRCQGNLVVRHGKNGYFMGCSNYPKCKFTKEL